MAVPYTFGTATAAIPLSQLDSNFATAITLGNTAVYLGNTTTSIGNLTLTNVTISSGEVTTGNASVSGNVTLTGGTANGVAYLNGSKVLTTGSALVFDGTNLGVGVTPSAWDANGKAIENPGGALYNYTTDQQLLIQNAFFDGAWKYKTTAQASYYQQAAGKHAWFNAASGTAGNAITFTTAMTLDASGNLGIGTTSPSFRLHAVSSAAVVSRIGSSGGSGAFINFIDSGASPSVAPSVGAIGNNLVFMGDGSSSERARIDSSGNLLVGTTNTNPAGSGVTGVVIGPTGAIKQSSGSGASYFAVTGTSGTHIQFYTYNAGAVAAGLISSNGSTTSYTGASDYRLKENIAPMTGALAKVAQLNPVTYKWKLDGSDGQGFIAHELQTIFPDAVVGEKDAVNEDGSIKPQGIDTSFLVATLTAAIQEQQAIITQLTARITALESA